jgi:hypothetical protein
LDLASLFRVPPHHVPGAAVFVHGLTAREPTFRSFAAQRSNNRYIEHPMKRTSGTSTVPEPGRSWGQRLIRSLGPDAEGKRPRKTSTQELSEREREPLPVSFILFVVFANASSSQR